MNIHALRETITARSAEANGSPPDTCVGCPNLDFTCLASGRILLTCWLERTLLQTIGPCDNGAEDGATAKCVDRALMDDLSSAGGADRWALDFRGCVEAANDNCPLVESVVNQLVAARVAGSGGAIINLAPPEPLVTYSTLRQLRAI